MIDAFKILLEEIKKMAAWKGVIDGVLHDNDTRIKKLYEQNAEMLSSLKDILEIAKKRNDPVTVGYNEKVVAAIADRDYNRLEAIEILVRPIIKPITR